MKVVKKFMKDNRTLLVSEIFDRVLLSNPSPLPQRLELHIRDREVTMHDEKKAIICFDYNNPLILDMDSRAITAMVRREFTRLLMQDNLPRLIGDVMVGKEMIRQGFGDDLFYMHYNYMLKAPHDGTKHDFIVTNVPWTIFYGLDDYNSRLLRLTAEKLVKRSYPEAKKLMAILCRISDSNAAGAVKEYAFVFG